ncbi:MAG TPA: hypothetical protein VLW85_13000 [Myxococcales bacterium]|nr:hypothetical protein [Myxococcales bacterium]
MPRSLLAAALALAACGTPDNLVIGGISPGPATPLVVFDTINSSISGTITLTDGNGNPTGQSAVVIISDHPDLCNVLKTKPGFFRVPTESYEALILFMPPGFLGTFVIGRGGDADNATSSEIIAPVGPVLSSVTRGPANAGSGTLALSGTPAQVYTDVLVKITGAGDLGTATFQYSLDGGATYSSDVTVPAGGAYALDVTGVTVTFSAGAASPSFAAGDTFSFTLAPVAPFNVLGGGSYVALTEWSDAPGGHASGSFDLFYGNATIGGVFEFTGRFNTDVCQGLDGVLLP